MGLAIRSYHNDTFTTVNIVALGYIPVRGLFHENENEDAKKEVPKNSKVNSQNLNTKQTKL